MTEIAKILRSLNAIDWDDLMTYVASLPPDERFDAQRARMLLDGAITYANTRDEIAAGRLTITFNGPRKRMDD